MICGYPVQKIFNGDMGIVKSFTVWPSVDKIVYPFTMRFFQRKVTGISRSCAEFSAILWDALTVLNRVRVPLIKCVFHFALLLHCFFCSASLFQDSSIERNEYKVGANIHKKILQGFCLLLNFSECLVWQRLCHDSQNLSQGF